MFHFYNELFLHTWLNLYFNSRSGEMENISALSLSSQREGGDLTAAVRFLWYSPEIKMKKATSSKANYLKCCLFTFLLPVKGQFEEKFWQRCYDKVTMCFLIPLHPFSLMTAFLFPFFHFSLFFFFGQGCGVRDGGGYNLPSWWVDFNALLWHSPLPWRWSVQIGKVYSQPLCTAFWWVFGCWWQINCMPVAM